MVVTEQELEDAVEESFGMLKQPELEHDDMTFGEKVIAHFGVKGMRWGVRKSDSGGGTNTSAPKQRGAIRRGLTKSRVAGDAARAEVKKGEKDLLFLPGPKRVDAANRTVSRARVEAASINADPQFKGKDLKGDAALTKAYSDKVAAVAKKIYQEELEIARTEAWGDFFGADVSLATRTMRINAAKDRLQHAADSGRETVATFDLVLNDLGQIVDFKVRTSEMQQSDPVEEFLQHMGIRP